MRKKLGLSMLTVGIIAIGVLLFSAFESYLLNIRAHVDTALEVYPHGSWDLGNVFPEEDFDLELKVATSKSFRAEANVNSVGYVIRCTAKGTALNLCTNISVSED